LHLRLVSSPPNWLTTYIPGSTPNARWRNLNIDTRPHALCNHSSIIRFSFGWETWRWPI